MSKRSAGKKSPGKKTASSSVAKGELVEEIVEKMHANPNVGVQRRVFLDPLAGSGKREIDVLLTSSVAGYPVRLAIECKNEKAQVSRGDGTGSSLNFCGPLSPTPAEPTAAAGRIVYEDEVRVQRRRGGSRARGEEMSGG